MKRVVEMMRQYYVGSFPNMAERLEKYPNLEKARIIIFDKDGNEKERKVPEDRLSNITDELPVRFTKFKLKRKDAVKKFVFSRTLQLWHSDGLTFEFLFNIAKELDDNDEMMTIMIMMRIY